jgi:hypothetical protein
MSPGEPEARRLLVPVTTSDLRRAAVAAAAIAVAAAARVEHSAVR